MRAVVQRVKEAKVTVEGQVAGEIGAGLVILLGIGQGDRQKDAERLADKIVNLRIFSDEEGKFNRSILDAGGQALVVSQFTLYADSKKGRRPSFTNAAPAEVADPLVKAFVQALANRGIKVEEGQFGAMMDVHLVNEGPVTIILDTAEI